MSGFVLWVEGTLFSRDEQAALMLRPGETQYALRLGFILRGSEEVILPESLLDDWGHELAAPALYEWVRENGLHFPRAEIFGFELNGRPGQCFVREVDLMAGYACFAFESEDAPLASGIRLNAILIPRADSGPPRRLPAPAEISAPLSMAAAEWWSVDPAATGQPDLDYLDELDERRSQ
jgi:hypothetical protein